MDIHITSSPQNPTFLSDVPPSGVVASQGKIKNIPLAMRGAINRMPDHGSNEWKPDTEEFAERYIKDVSAYSEAGYRAAPWGRLLLDDETFPCRVDQAWDQKGREINFSNMEKMQTFLKAAKKSRPSNLIGYYCGLPAWTGFWPNTAEDWQYCHRVWSWEAEWMLPLVDTCVLDMYANDIDGKDETSMEDWIRGLEFKHSVATQYNYRYYRREGMRPRELMVLVEMFWEGNGPRSYWTKVEGETFAQTLQRSYIGDHIVMQMAKEIRRRGMIMAVFNPLGFGFDAMAKACLSIP